jgi:arylsulfatase A-like enzyme
VSWELFGSRAVRKGDLKLLWLAKPFGSGDWELYDLANDPGELNGLSKQRPQLLDDMVEIWEQYARETGVVLPSVSPLNPKSE